MYPAPHLTPGPFRAFPRAGKLFPCLMTLFFLWVWALPCHPEVVTDGTMGPALTLAGPNFSIPENLGTIQGNNLFHSFLTFGLDQGQSATFTGPDHIARVISRVTGNQASALDGLLKSTVGQAAVYFINPRGILFGPNARVDVPGAFHASTADQLNFSDGNIYSAASPDTSTLTAAPPESFGFLGAGNAAIQVNGTVLRFDAAAPVSLTSGDISLTGPGAGMENPRAEIRLTAQGNSPGNVGLSSAPSLSPAGEVNLTGARVETSGPSGGILISGGQMRITQQEGEAFAGLISDAGTGTTPGTIRVHLTGDLILEGAAGLASLGSGQANAGPVQVSARRLAMDGKNRAAPFRDTAYICGISSEAAQASAGNAGPVSVDIVDAMSVKGGAVIASYAGGTGRGDQVTVRAGSLTIDGSGTAFLNGIMGNGPELEHGSTLDIQVDDHLILVSGAQIFTLVTGDARTGILDVAAGNILLDGGSAGAATGIFSQTSEAATGSAGPVRVLARETLDIRAGAEISSNTFDAGNAGPVTVSARDLMVDGEGATFFTGIASQAASPAHGSGGRITVTADRSLTLVRGGQIAANTYSRGDAGDISITAGTLKIDSQGFAGHGTEITGNSEFGAQGNGGRITIQAESVSIQGRARITASAASNQGNAGSIRLTADSLSIIADNTDSLNPTGMTCNVTILGDGQAGTIDLAIDGPIRLVSGAMISTSTLGQGHAGNIMISAGNLEIDGQGKQTGITSDSEFIADGNAGNITVTANGPVILRDKGRISSNTMAGGHAGRITLKAGSLVINGQDRLGTGIYTRAEVGSKGRAGDLDITIMGNAALAGQGQVASDTWGDGDGGTITMDVSGSLAIESGAEIASGTWWQQGNAGDVEIRAGEIRINSRGSSRFTGIESQAGYGTQGDAGNLTVTSQGLIALADGGQITTSTAGLGNAGKVLVAAKEMTMDGTGPSAFRTGIWSDAEIDSTGHAGTLEIQVDHTLEMTGKSRISTNTEGPGNAGDITVRAQALAISGEKTGISSAASDLSQGAVGNILIQAPALTLSKGAEISITADQTLTEKQLSDLTRNAVAIETAALRMDQNAAITAESRGNVPAGSIHIRANQAQIHSSSRLTTQADQADGGPVTIQTHTLYLNDGLITTSVSGNRGDGGDIQITGTGSPTQYLVLKGGFIQANTGAADARGGDITIDAQAVVPDAETCLVVGGKTRQAFRPGSRLNVIQAAAPGGEHGTIRLTAPEADISSSAVPINTQPAAPVRLATDPCQTAGHANTLVQGGPRGIPQGPDALAVVPLTNRRLDRLLQ